MELCRKGRGRSLVRKRGVSTRDSGRAETGVGAGSRKPRY